MSLDILKLLDARVLGRYDLDIVGPEAHHEPEICGFFSFICTPGAGCLQHGVGHRNGQLTLIGQNGIDVFSRGTGRRGRGGVAVILQGSGKSSADRIIDAGSRAGEDRNELILPFYGFGLLLQALFRAGFRRRRICSCRS